MVKVPTYVKEIMTHNVVTIESSQTVYEGARLMNETLRGGRKIGSLVVTKNGKVVGIVTEIDFIIRGILRKLPPEARIEEIMSYPVIACTPNTSLIEAARLMEKHKIRHLPILEDEGLVGIVAGYDFIQYAWPVK